MTMIMMRTDTVYDDVKLRMEYNNNDKDNDNEGGAMTMTMKMTKMTWSTLLYFQSSRMRELS